MSRRFQFGLRAILLAPVIAGIALIALMPHDGWAGFYLAFALRIGLIAVPVPALVMIAQGGRWTRAFGIGALCPALIGLLIAAQPLFVHSTYGFVPQTLMDLVRRNLWDDQLPLYDLQFRTAFVLAACLIFGIVGMVTSWFIATDKRER